MGPCGMSEPCYDTILSAALTGFVVPCCRYDEGTAFLPAVPSKRLLPVHDKFPFLALDAEGYDLPSDW